MRLKKYSSSRYLDIYFIFLYFHEIDIYILFMRLKKHFSSLNLLIFLYFPELMKQPLLYLLIMKERGQ